MNQAFPALSLFGQVARGSHEIGMESTPHDVGGAGPILRLLQLLQLKRLQRCWSARSIHCRVVCQCKATPVSAPGPFVPPAKAAQRLSSWPNTSPFCFVPAAPWIDIYLSRHREGSLLGKTILWAHSFACRRDIIVSTKRTKGVQSTASRLATHLSLTGPILLYVLEIIRYACESSKHCLHHI